MKQNNKINICFILGGFTRVGGIGRVTSILTNELAKDNSYNILNVSFTNRQEDNLYEISSNIKHEYLLDEHTSMTKAILQKNAIRRLRNILMENKIDIVVACGAMFYPLVLLATRKTEIKTIAWEHYNLNNTTGYKFQKQARWMAANFADRIVVLTMADMREFENKYSINTVRQIYNPIDEAIDEYIKPYDIESKKIISVGRLAYQKNFENAIQVAQQILPQFPDWTWDIYGQGEDFESLDKLIKDSNLQNQMKLKGRVNNLYDLYNDYSFLVMTSRFEGFPMTLLEGMAFGLPLVSYDIKTGPNEIIVDGENGYLVPFEDGILMADNITELIENVDLRRKFSYSNIKKKNEYTLKNITQEWKNIIKDVMK